MLSVSSTPMLVRSSLEEMLDSLRRRDENEIPKDLPPALPARPTSKARRPSNKRLLPSKPDNSSLKQPVNLSCTEGQVEEKVKRFTRGGGFGHNKLKKAEPDETPYAQQRVDQNNGANLAASLATRYRESEFSENIGYFIREVQIKLYYYSCSSNLVFINSVYLSLFFFMCFRNLEFGVRLTMVIGN